MNKMANFPSEGKSCRNPKCMRMAKRENDNYIKFGEVGDQLLEDFLSQENSYEMFKLSRHAEQRAVERVFSQRILFTMLTETGYCISRREDNVYIFKGILKSSRGVYRHFHIVLEFIKIKNKLMVYVITAYDATSSAHLYDSNFEVRHCWCQPHYLDE